MAKCILRFITEFNTHYGDRIPFNLDSIIYTIKLPLTSTLYNPI